jgi:hypothetical protein
MINFLDANEAPTFESVLKRMSEDGRCLLTGEIKDLTYFPVDTNPQNFLPSNMACVTDQIAGKVSYTYFYDVPLWEYTLTLDTPEVFQTYNENVVEIIQATKLEDKEQFQPSGPTQYIRLFEYLTRFHLKGIAKISHGKTYMDNTQYQGYLLRVLANQKKSQSQSKIITSHNLGIVK